MEKFDSSVIRFEKLAAQQREHADALEAHALRQGALTPELAATIAYVRAEADRCDYVAQMLRGGAAA